MTDQELEQRLADAIDRAAPNDIEAVLSRCAPRQDNVIPIQQDRPAGGRKKWKRWIPAAAAACLALAVVGGGAGYVRQLNSAVASVVCLDVNPSIQLTVNRNERVLSATPANADAEIILAGMDLTGAKVDAAMNAIVGSLLTNGYVDQLANSILITVEDDDAQRGAQLQQELTAQADAILAGAQVNGAILSQTIQNSAQLQQLSEEYGISAGKAALIQTIVEGSGGTKTFQDLVGLSINELNLLYSSLNEQMTGTGTGDTGTDTAPAVQSTGQANDSAYIGMEAAQQAALAHAGVSAADATFLEAEYDWDDGRMVYEVEFRSDSVEYEYEIDALTGEIVKYQSEGGGRPSQSGGQTGGVDTSSFIGEGAAKAAALADAGVRESDTTYCNAWLDYDDGRPECYEVEFMAGNTRYEYKIALTSAAVLEREQETYGRPSSGGNTGSGGSSGGAAGTDIGAEAAQQAALNHAGVSLSDTYEMKVERDYDDGRLEYEIDFKAGGYEYEYTIDAATGTILDYERDWD